MSEQALKGIFVKNGVIHGAKEITEIRPCQRGTSPWCEGEQLPTPPLGTWFTTGWMMILDEHDRYIDVMPKDKFLKLYSKF